MEISYPLKAEVHTLRHCRASTSERDFVIDSYMAPVKFLSIFDTSTPTDMPTQSRGPQECENASKMLRCSRIPHTEPRQRA